MKDVKNRLHFGCGNDKLQDYINCDISADCAPDMVVDLEHKLPFPDNYTDEILMNHVLEHITNFIDLMHELHRISKNGAVLSIRTPFYSAWGQYNDPTHVRFFSPFTFNYFKEGIYSHEVKCNKQMFEVKKVKINFAVGTLSFLNPIINPIVNLSHKIYCRFFAWTLPCSEMYYELIVKK